MKVVLAVLVIALGYSSLVSGRIYANTAVNSTFNEWGLEGNKLLLQPNFLVAGYATKNYGGPNARLLSLNLSSNLKIVSELNLQRDCQTLELEQIGTPGLLYVNCIRFSATYEVMLVRIQSNGTLTLASTPFAIPYLLTDPLGIDHNDPSSVVYLGYSNTNLNSYEFYTVSVVNPTSPKPALVNHLGNNIQLSHQAWNMKSGIAFLGKSSNGFVRLLISQRAQIDETSVVRISAAGQVTQKIDFQRYQNVRFFNWKGNNTTGVAFYEDFVKNLFIFSAVDLDTYKILGSGPYTFQNANSPTVSNMHVSGSQAKDQRYSAFITGTSQGVLQILFDANGLLTYTQSVASFITGNFLTSDQEYVYAFTSTGISRFDYDSKAN